MQADYVHHSGNSLKESKKRTNKIWFGHRLESSWAAPWISFRNHFGIDSNQNKSKIQASRLGQNKQSFDSGLLALMSEIWFNNQLMNRALPNHPYTYGWKEQRKWWSTTLPSTLSIRQSPVRELKNESKGFKAVDQKLRSSNVTPYFQCLIGADRCLINFVCLFVWTSKAASWLG